MSKTIASTKRTKKYKALIAIGLDEATALKQLGHEPEADVDPRLATLLAAGFTEEEAAKHLGAQAAPAAEPAPEPQTAKEEADALVEQNGFAFTKGRVYVTGDIIEAAVRVRKTGRPETIASSGVGRTKAVLIYKEESGDVAIQNLTRPVAE